MTDIVRTLGRYELHRRIAAGGMGEIFVAKSRGAGGFEKTVIIKTILPHLADEQEFVTKFLDEGRIVVNLTHGNIVPVFDMGEEKGEYFIAMEYVAGRDLRDILRHLNVSGRVLPVEYSLYILIELSKGLGYAHRKTDEQGVPLGIVHRDVSPSNVLLSREGEVKLIDFGIARATGKSSVTVSGRIQGKCCYMSPEQASGKNVDARSDIFAAGVLLYEMLTGIRPFEGDSDLETLELVRSCNFDAPGVLNTEVDAELDAIVTRALERDPAARYQTIEEMQIALTQRLYGGGHTVTSGEIAQFLGELFPEGVEPEALRIKSGMFGNVTTPSGLDLDAAFNFELARLGQEPELDKQVTAAGISIGNSAVFGETAPAIELPSSNRDKTADDISGSVENLSQISQPYSVEDENSKSGIDDLMRPPSRNSKRWLSVALLLGVVLGSGVVFWAFGPFAKGSLVLKSEPVGAQIFVNGAQLVGQTTPHTLELPAGMHNIQLMLDGYESRNFTLNLGRRQTLVLDHADTVLKPIRMEPLELRPPVASEKPVEDVKPESVGPSAGAEKTEVATADVDVKAIIPAALPTDAPKTGNPSDPRPSRAARQVRVRIDSRPSGARIAVNGMALGTAPVEAEYSTLSTLQVRAELAGYAPQESSHTVSRLNHGQLIVELAALEMGCLDFRAMEPAHNELTIDGRRLEGRRMMLKGHPLSVGKHTILVRNPDAGREETFSFTIEPGPRCTYLGVWEPER